MKISNIANCIKTTLKVEVEGYFVERFINLCIINKLNIWNIKNLNSGKINFYSTPKELEKMEPLLNRTKCKLKVVKKMGAYYKILKYKKRRIALIFFILVLIGIYISSTFLWDIKVHGNCNISTEEILAKLKENDIYKGKNKFAISESKVSDYIRSVFYEVAWAGVKINGTTLDVQIVEKVISDTKEENEKVGNIIATKDAIITKIVAQNGTALYKLESFIPKDSVAIEGKMYVNGEVAKLVHATGSLRGKVKYTFSKEYEFNEIQKDYTGKTRKGIGFGINNKKIVAKYLPKEYKYDISSEEKVLNIFGLELKLVLEKYVEYTQKQVVSTKEELLKRGEEDSEAFLKALEEENKKYVSHTVNIEDTEYGIIYNKTFVIDEDIGKFVELGEWRMGISVDYYTNYEKEEALKKYNEFITKYKDKIDCLIRKAFELEGFNLPNVYVGVGVVTESEIQKINSEFRNVDRPTDVLSFPIFSREELEKIKKEKTDEEMSLGDIVLCMDVIEAHSVEYGTGFNREMLYMIVHGICHLLGYDHEIEEEKKQMRALEEKILEGCN